MIFSIFLITTLLYISLLIIRISIKQIILSRKYSKFSKFNKKIISYADEVDDISIRLEIINYGLDNLSTFIQSNDGSFPIVEKEKEFFDKYSKYIPSLVIDKRDQNINKILNVDNLSKL